MGSSIYSQRCMLSDQRRRGGKQFTADPLMMYYLIMHVLTAVRHDIFVDNVGLKGVPANNEIVHHIVNAGWKCQK